MPATDEDIERTAQKMTRDFMDSVDALSTSGSECSDADTAPEEDTISNDILHEINLLGYDYADLIENGNAETIHFWTLSRPPCFLLTQRNVLSDVPPQPTEVSNVLYAGAVFPNPEELFNCIESTYLYCGALKSNLSQNTKGSFSAAEEQETFGHVYAVGKARKKGGPATTPKRGRHYCTEPGCNWNVAYTYTKSKGGYVILDNPLDDSVKYKTHFLLQHNHDTKMTTMDNYFVVTKREDLTSSEMKTLKTLAFAHTQMPAIQQAMMSEYSSQGNRAFLLQSSATRGLEMLGRNTISEGGRFEVDIDAIHSIRGTRFQTPRMVYYSEQYGGYLILADGTYSTNMYGLTLIPWIVVDCLGIGHVCGISTGLYENTVDVVNAGTLFGVSSIIRSIDADVSFAVHKSHNETETRIDDILICNNVQQNCYQGTLGTDRASWTTGSAKLLGKDLMYCTRHESEYIMSAGAGLSGRSQNLFMAEMNAMLYDITSREELASRFVKAYQYYGHHSPASCKSIHRYPCQTKREALMKQALEDVESMLNAHRLETALSDLKSSSSLNQAAHDLKAQAAQDLRSSAVSHENNGVTTNSYTASTNLQPPLMPMKTKKQRARSARINNSRLARGLEKGVPPRRGSALYHRVWRGLRLHSFICRPMIRNSRRAGAKHGPPRFPCIQRTV
eukprot:scaffold76595_cov24-Cyclotella_meneghiniana.AAC.1